MTIVSRNFRKTVRDIFNARIDQMATKKVLAIKQELERQMAAETKSDLPKGCELLIALVTKSADRDVVLGDSAERFAKDVARHGRRRALLLQWRDILAAIPSNVWTSLVKAIKWLAIGTAIERIFFR